MLCIHNTQTDPYFNLAAEEYLLKNFKENIFMLWQNEPSIVIGKHQDVWAEVNLKFVQDQQIKIARRFSGGGAVYHDPGNLNLTFIETGQIMQTDKYTIQIMNFLKTLGVHVEMDERKGLTIGGFKISGSAQSIHKNRYMHHATLLFSTDLDRLVTSLKSTSRQTPEKTGGKRSTFVKSVRSPVTNITVYRKMNWIIFRVPDIWDVSVRKIFKRISITKIKVRKCRNRNRLLFLPCSKRLRARR